MEPSYHSEGNEIKFLHDHMVRSQIIYAMVLIAVAGMIMVLPVIRVSLSIQGRGIIRPFSEIAEIRVIPSAPVSAVYISEGHRVEKGDTLLTLGPEGIESRLKFMRRELQTTENYIADLLNLTSEKKVTCYQSDLYRIQYGNYSRKIAEIDFRIGRANQDVVREKPLFDNKLISEKEYEGLSSCRDQLENEKRVMEASQMLQWRSELARHCSDRDSYIAQIDQMEKERELYIIRSPVKGTIESFPGIYPGCNLQSGQVVAVISPDNTLVAEIFVQARNVGMLFKGMPVKIQIDAFNYMEWGMIDSQITRISDDYFLQNQVAVFKVECSLDSLCLRLKNGIPGKIKKGMTLNARFLVTRRSLFQLLYQNSDDWLNPSRNPAGL
jgi:HlyD family secretion protein